MEKHFFIELLKKFLNGDTTVEEDELLHQYYNFFENEDDIIALISSENKEKLKRDMYASIQKNIIQKDHHLMQIRTIRRWALSGAAAIFLLLAGIGIYRYLLVKPEIKIKGQLVQTAIKKQNRLFHLTDGSTVLLSYGSSLNISPDFGKGTTREVYLEGQAYFDIHHDERKPFIVHTGKVATTVLGTAFNIKAYHHEDHITVTVKRGKVKVSDQHKTLDLLTPDQQIVYNKVEEKAIKNKVDATKYISWRNQDDLVIDNVSFEETAQLLEERFNTTIRFKDASLKAKRFTTVLLEKENLEQSIKSICEFNNAQWHFSNDKKLLIISKKR